MKIKKVYSVYFSPTGGTKACTDLVAKKLSEKLGAGFESISITKPDERKVNYNFSKDEIVVLGAPCYAGNLPVVEGLFDNLISNGALVVPVTSFGNRDYDYILVQMRDDLLKKGFHPIAAGAFIAVHSFTDLCGKGRPDEKDITLINEMAEKISEKVLKGEISGSLYVKGEDKFKAMKRMAACPETTNECKECLKCVDVCPTGAITKENFKIPDENLCISCVACAKICENFARNTQKEGILKVKKFLEENCTKRVEAEYFVI